jgi:hypothetical protein
MPDRKELDPLARLEALAAEARAAAGRTRLRVARSQDAVERAILTITKTRTRVRELRDAVRVLKAREASPPRQ